MVRKLGELDQLKKDFVSHVSHELKAPLASMQETTKLLLEGIPGDLNDSQRQLLRLNLGSTERLFSMIKNLLDLSSMEAGAVRYHFEEKDITVAVQRAVDEYHGLYLEKQVRVELAFPERPVMVKIDEERVVQAIGNLIANAIRFSPKGESVLIQVKKLDGLPRDLSDLYCDQFPESSAGYCIISVHDRGPGVPDEDKERIFQRFYVMEKVRKETGENTGLGLAISRNIVSAHAGVIWIDDNPGGGSVFSLLFPALEAD
jgi:signal transduction histidine kinase